MRVDANDVSAEGMTGQDDRSGQIERMNQAMQIVGQAAQRPVAVNRRAPAEARAVIAVGLRTRCQLAPGPGSSSDRWQRVQLRRR